MKTNIKDCLNTLKVSDIYSLMLFILYKVRDIPEYAVLSELCYLLDSTNMTRLLTYFSGKTITFPTEEEMAILTNALLLYQYVNIEGDSLIEGQSKLRQLGSKQKEKVTDLYLQIIPIINNYNINRREIHANK